MKTYCPAGGSILAPDDVEADAGADDEVEDAFDAPPDGAEIPAGISTDFQSSPDSTVRAINSPTLKLLPSVAYATINLLTDVFNTKYTIMFKYSRTYYDFGKNTFIITF